MIASTRVATAPAPLDGPTSRRRAGPSGRLPFCVLRTLVAHIGDELRLVLACDLEILDSFGKLAGARLHFLQQVELFPRSLRCGDLVRFLSCSWLAKRAQVEL